MAVPIKLESSHPDAQEELLRRLEQAPAEHADALLAAYEVVQALHDRGILDALKGALSSSDFILETLVETANTPQTVRLIRNLLLLSQMAGEIEPELLGRIAAAVPASLAQAASAKTETPGLFALLHRFSNPDSRRGMAFAAALLENLGKRLAG